LRFARTPRVRALLSLVLLLLLTTRTARADVTLLPQQHLPIQINAAAGETWTEGAYRVWSLREGCEIKQGDTRIAGREAVLWIEPGSLYGDQPWKVIAYVEGQVTILVGNQPQPTSTAQPGSLQPKADAGKPGAGQTWFGRLYSKEEPRIRIANLIPNNGAPAQPPPDNAAARQNPLVARAWQQFAPPVTNAIYNGAPNNGTAPSPAQRADGASAPTMPNNPITRSQYAEYGGGPSQPAAPVLPSNQPGMRRIQVFPRSSVALQAEYFPSPGGNETTVVINSGVQVRVDGLGSGMAGGPMGGLGSTIDISADRVVLWTGGGIGDLAAGGNQRTDTPLEIYMEGDIVFREGDRVIFAQAMYYNVALRNGVILQAELLTPVPNYAGLVRLRANVIRQIDEANFIAESASVTTSRLAMPTYEFRAGTLTLNDTQIPQRDPASGLPIIDPRTGEPLADHRQTITSNNNVVFAGGIPIFYWPVMTTDLQKPTFYINDINIGNDNIFGMRGSVGFDAYQLLGIRTPPPNTDFDIDLGYMSKRGFNAAAKFTYGSDFLFGSEKPFRGLLDAFYIHDGGLDTLGTDRVNMVPEATERYRILGQHRQILDNGWQISVESGLISDRNFLEQYYEREWDDQKDQITGLELKRIFDNTSLALALDYNPNEFFLRVNQLPRVDYFNLGTALFDNRATGYLHVSGGYFQTRMASTPTAPQDLATFSPLPYERDLDFERFDIRPNIEFPIPFLDTKITPFAIGGASHYGADLNGDDIQRVYGQAGVKTTLPFTGYYPEFESELLNVHGVAHKVNWDLEYSYTDSSQNVDQFALIDEIDDDNVQHFRRRLAFQDFGGPAPVPQQFDERYYGVRRGLMDNVTGPTEIVDDLSVARLGLRNRWQTKRGPEGNRRIIDWVMLDTHFEIYPNKDDNFGENAGLLDYDFRWFVGDRLSLLSSGAADFFVDGQRYVQVGAQINRPKRGNVYVGYRSLQGPIDANILLATINYRLSPKWVAAAGISYQFGGLGTLGETLTLTRIGESFLVSAAFNVDNTRDNVGATLYIEPRFLPRTRFGRSTGLDVPLAGQYGLE
jgi:hypothetical protein